MHILLTVLGRRTEPSTYSLGDRVCDARLAPLALVKLLGDPRPDRVLALCTPEAKADSWPVLESELAGQCRVEAIDVPAGHAPEDVDGFLSAVLGAIPSERSVSLTVDITHGFRHFAVLMYAAVLYLAALRKTGAEVKVEGAFYGLLGAEGSISPFFDLRPLLELPRWIHAIDVLDETGSARPLATLLRSGSRAQRPQPSQRARSLATDLERISESYLAGLPVELGRGAADFIAQRPKSFRKLLRERRLPLANNLVTRVIEVIEDFALGESVHAVGGNWKHAVPLNDDELERQVRVIDDLLDRQNVSSALGLMREWVVSWALLSGEGYDLSRWLDHKAGRSEVELALGALTVALGDPASRDTMSDEQRQLAEFWQMLGDLRNALHHHGMRLQVLHGDRGFERKLERVREFWTTTMRLAPAISLVLRRTGPRALVSPGGRRPGALFSALEHARRHAGAPLEHGVVICSAQTETVANEALDRARFTGERTMLRFEDPQGGLDEMEAIVRRATKTLAGASEIYINITGGTTLMSVSVDKVHSELRRCKIPVRRFGVIDRRGRREQDEQPYRLGEPLWLGSEQNA